VKDATGDLPAAAVVVTETPEGFEVYSGDDALTLPFLSVGGVGVISVASHWAGRLLADMIECYRVGEVDRAAVLNRRLAESYRFESSDEYPNPVPAKAACRALGLQVGQCRLPHPPAPGDLDDLARSIIARSGATDAAQRSVA
jgi:4-hydroxy-tetrahydrodipicolinate synthase